MSVAVDHVLENSAQVSVITAMTWTALSLNLNVVLPLTLVNSKEVNMMFQKPAPTADIANGSALPIRYIERFPENRERLLDVVGKLNEGNAVHPESIGLTQDGLNAIAFIASDAAMPLFHDDAIPEPEKKTHLRSSWHILDGELFLLVKNMLHKSYCIGQVPKGAWSDRLEMDEHTGNG